MEGGLHIYGKTKLRIFNPHQVEAWLHKMNKAIQSVSKALCMQSMTLLETKEERFSQWHLNKLLFSNCTFSCVA
jgi:hypothetical protein